MAISAFWKFAGVLGASILAAVLSFYLNALSPGIAALTGSTWGGDGGGSEEAAPKTFLLSQDPLVVYIQNFVSPREAGHLVRLAEGRFRDSPLYDNQGKKHVDKAYRRSTTAKLDRSDAVVAAMEARARSFPFYQYRDPKDDFQPIVVQNYGLAGVYRDHYDWFDEQHANQGGGNVASTFFVYIHANCTGGGTNFPRLQPPPEDAVRSEDSAPWCEFLDCDRPLDEGVTFKPIVGNAIYWENLDARGVGHWSTLHAGLPVTSGRKMGLNMWTWKNA